MKGKVCNKKKYVTLKDGGCDFRKMAKIMTDAGFKMNHATARNQLILAIESLMGHVSSQLRIKLSNEQIKNMISDQDVHDQLSDVLYRAYKELQQEEYKNGKK